MARRGAGGRILRRAPRKDERRRPVCSSSMRAEACIAGDDLAVPDYQDQLTDFLEGLTGADLTTFTNKCAAHYTYTGR